MESIKIRLWKALEVNLPIVLMTMQKQYILVSNQCYLLKKNQ